MSYLIHHGVKGMKWGVRRYQNYDGTRIKTGTVFVSGSSKTQSEDSPYYRKSLPEGVTKQLDDHMKRGSKIIVGDAPGIDRQVQDYLAKNKYENVEVYGPGTKVRYSADSKWKTNAIDSDYEEGSKEWLAEKDKMMAEVATEGIAVVLPEGSKATRKNISRLLDKNKNVSVYELHDNEADDKNYSLSSASSKDFITVDTTGQAVNRILSTMDDTDRDRLNLEAPSDNNPSGYLSVEQGAVVAKRILLKDSNNTPVAFFDLLDDGDSYNIALGTRYGKEYRGKGHAKQAVRYGMDWYEANKDKPAIWGVKVDNIPSIRLAEEQGFELDKNSYSDDYEWVNYVRR